MTRSKRFLAFLLCFAMLLPLLPASVFAAEGDVLKLDNGYEQETILLDQPNEGIYIANDMWREMYDFSPDAVLIVIASELYDESDYIRDYDAFLKYVQGRQKEKTGSPDGND